MANTTVPVLPSAVATEHANYTLWTFQAVLPEHCGVPKNRLHLLLVQAVLEEDEGGVAGAVLVVGKAQRGLGVHGLAKEAAAQQRRIAMQISMQPRALVASMYQSSEHEAHSIPLQAMGPSTSSPGALAYA